MQRRIHRPACKLQVLPLGTGNDLSLTFGWGNTFLPAWLRRSDLPHHSCDTMHAGMPDDVRRHACARAVPRVRTSVQAYSLWFARGSSRTALRPFTTCCGASRTPSHGSWTAGAFPSAQV